MHNGISITSPFRAFLLLMMMFGAPLHLTYAGTKKFTVAEQVQNVNKCIMSSICYPKIKKRGRSDKRTLNISGRSLVSKCSQELAVRAPIYFNLSKFNPADLTLDYTLMYGEGDQLKLNRTVMNCTTLAYLDADACLPANKNLQDLAEIASTGIEVKVFGDVYCEDPLSTRLLWDDGADVAYETVDFSSEAYNPYDPSNGSLQNRYKNDIDFTALKFGYGFKKVGNECQRICKDGEVFKEVSGDTSTHESSYKDWWTPEDGGGSHDGGYEYTDISSTPIENAKFKCVPCSSGKTRKDNNKCFENPTDKCGVNEELVAQPLELSGYFFYSCQPKCMDGYVRGPMGCQPTPKKLEEIEEKFEKMLAEWAQEKDFQNQYIGGCLSHDLIVAAKKYKQHMRKSHVSGQDVYNGSGGTTFGAYLATQGSPLCQAEFTSDILVKHPDSVSAGVWKMLSFPHSRMDELFPERKTMHGDGFGFGY